MKKSNIGFKKLIIIPVCCVLIFTSCAHQKQVVPEPVKLPEKFSYSGEEKIPGKWWKVLNDSQLDYLIEKALEGNFDLKAVRDKLDQAYAVARKTGALIYPSMETSASGSKTKTFGNSGEENLSNRTGESFTLSLNTSYEVDLWNKVGSSRKAATLDTEATDQDLRAAAMSLTSQVASNWYQLITLQTQMKLLKRQIKTDKEYLQLINLRYKKGKVSVTDVLQQRKLLISTHSEKIQLQSQIKILEHQLAILLGNFPKSIEFPEKVKLPELPPLPESGLPSEWVKQRPDIKSSYLTIKADNHRLAAAIADRFPSFNISLQIESAAAVPSELFREWATQLIGQFSQTILDGRKKSAEVDRTKAVVSESIHNYSQTVLKGLKEVEDALIQEIQQRKYLKNLEEQLNLSSQTVVNLRSAYTKGSIDFLKVLDAVKTHQTLEKSIITARGELIQYRINLYCALGGGWEPERQEKKGG